MNWIIGIGEHSVNFPCAYSAYVAVNIGSTQSYDSGACPGVYDVSLIGCRTKVMDYGQKHYNERWVIHCLGY